MYSIISPALFAPCTKLRPPPCNMRHALPTYNQSLFQRPNYFSTHLIVFMHDTDHTVTYCYLYCYNEWQYKCLLTYNSNSIPRVAFHKCVTCVASRVDVSHTLLGVCARARARSLCRSLSLNLLSPIAFTPMIAPTMFFSHPGPRFHPFLYLHAVDRSACKRERSNIPEITIAPCLAKPVGAIHPLA